MQVDDERFKEWLKINGYVADESIDIDTLKEVFEAMDDENK